LEEGTGITVGDRRKVLLLIVGGRDRVKPEMIEGEYFYYLNYM